MFNIWSSFDSASRFTASLVEDFSTTEDVESETPDVIELNELSFGRLLREARSELGLGRDANDDRSTALLAEKEVYIQAKQANSDVASADLGEDSSDYDLSGSFRKKAIFADSGSDTIKGGRNDDMLNGGDGDDIIYGGDGNDILEGGKGNDVLYGGQDIDVFVFHAGDGTTTIGDFELGYDILDLDGFGRDVSYEELFATGRQVNDNIHFEIGDDVLILANADLSTLVADDLCIR